jgi:hypothetical protein
MWFLVVLLQVMLRHQPGDQVDELIHGAAHGTSFPIAQ